MIFSTFTWFGAAGTAVTFTATPPPGALPPSLSPPHLYGAALVQGTNDGHATNNPPLGGQQGPSGSGDQSTSGWKIGLVVGLVVGTVMLLGLILGLMWKRRIRCCWGRKDAERYRYELKVRHDTLLLGRGHNGDISPRMCISPHGNALGSTQPHVTSLIPAKLIRQMVCYTYEGG